VTRNGVNSVMPLRNRVDPFGKFHAVPDRGTMFGNRGGCMHREKQLVGRPWTSERWICCVLEFKGRHRPEMMAPGLYTELFFLDEATAFAAGHRPCMECRRADANSFIEAWARAHLAPGLRPASVSEIDRLAHRERIDPKTWEQRTSVAAPGALPDGVLVTRPRAPGLPFLVWRGGLRRWSFAGYSEPIPTPPGERLTVLTPPSFVAAFAAGYQPAVHPSAEGG